VKHKQIRGCKKVKR